MKQPADMKHLQEEFSDPRFENSPFYFAGIESGWIAVSVPGDHNERGVYNDLQKKGYAPKLGAHYRTILVRPATTEEIAEYSTITGG